VATGAAAPGRETIVELYAGDAVFVAGEGVKGREAIEVDACAIYYDQTRRRRHAATRQIGGGSMMYDLGHADLEIASAARRAVIALGAQRGVI